VSVQGETTDRLRERFQKSLYGPGSAVVGAGSGHACESRKPFHTRPGDFCAIGAGARYSQFASISLNGIFTRPASTSWLRDAVDKLGKACELVAGVSVDMSTDVEASTGSACALVSNQHRRTAGEILAEVFKTPST
jgi:hypothetical protein